MIFIVVGIFIVVASLFIARGFGMFELIRLRGAGFPAITAPKWDRVAPSGGWFTKMIAPTIDGHYWLYLLHGMIVNPIVGIITWTLTIVWVSTGLGGLSYWFWGRFIPDRRPRLDVLRCHLRVLHRPLHRRRPVHGRQHPVPDHRRHLHGDPAVRHARPDLGALRDRPRDAGRVPQRGVASGGVRSRVVEERGRRRGGHRAPPARARHPRRPAAAPGAPADGPGRRRPPARQGPEGRARPARGGVCSSRRTRSTNCGRCRADSRRRS